MNRTLRSGARLGAASILFASTAIVPTRADNSPPPATTIASGATDAPPGDFQAPDLSEDFRNGRRTVIPCEFYLNGILIPLPTPDKGRAFLLFDTGANEPMISAAFAAKMRIRGQTAFAATGIGSSAAAGSITAGITFSLPGVTFRKARWAILPNVGLDEEYGRPVVGILGMDLLKNFVIRVDAARQQIEFTSPGAFQPPGREAVCLPLRLGERGPMVRASIGGTRRAAAGGDFLIDTGYNGALELSRSFQALHPDLAFVPFASTAASGVGGVMPISEAICPRIDLGGIAVEKALVDLDQADQGVEVGVDGSIGNEIWRRFTVTMDLPAGKLYLQKNAHFPDPFSYVTAGMQVLASGAEYQTLTVHELLPGGAADSAGFESGDVLLRLDELEGRTLTIANLYPKLHQPGPLHFTVQRAGRDLALAFVLKNPALPDSGER